MMTFLRLLVCGSLRPSAESGDMYPGDIVTWVECNISDWKGEGRSVFVYQVSVILNLLLIDFVLWLVTSTHIHGTCYSGSVSTVWRVLVCLRVE